MVEVEMESEVFLAPNEPIRFLVIGAGGTGTFLLDPLIRYLTTYFGGQDGWELGVIDGDSVEEKNLSRQLFDPSAVTVNKAVAIVNKFSYLQNLMAIPEYLSADNIQQFLNEKCVVLIAVDNTPVRVLIEEHCTGLNNCAVINGGNEEFTGSTQLWIRQNGSNRTPNLTFLHPEITKDGEDRAAMTCQEIAHIQGGEQLITANMASAMFMLTALMQIMPYVMGKDAFGDSGIRWTEIQFNLNTATTYAMDNREKRGWD
jgi:molybdopterin/thiamine biosynthesis adenylyltransferase